MTRVSGISNSTFAEATNGLPGRRVGYRQTMNLEPDIADDCCKRRRSQLRAQATSVFLLREVSSDRQCVQDRHDDVDEHS